MREKKNVDQRTVEFSLTSRTKKKTFGQGNDRKWLGIGVMFSEDQQRPGTLSHFNPHPDPVGPILPTQLKLTPSIKTDSGEKQRTYTPGSTELPSAKRLRKKMESSNNAYLPSVTACYAVMVSSRKIGANCAQLSFRHFPSCNLRCWWTRTRARNKEKRKKWRSKTQKTYVVPFVCRRETSDHCPLKMIRWC